MTGEVSCLCAGYWPGKLLRQGRPCMSMNFIQNTLTIELHIELYELHEAYINQCTTETGGRDKGY